MIRQRRKGLPYVVGTGEEAVFQPCAIRGWVWLLYKDIQHGIHHAPGPGACGCNGQFGSGGAARYGAKAVSAASR